MVKKIILPCDEQRKPVGQYHPKAKLSDADIELIRDIYDEGLVGYGTLAKVFGVKKHVIRDIVTFRRRSTAAVHYRTVEAGTLRPVPKDRLEQLGVDIEIMDDDWDNNH